MKFAYQRSGAPLLSWKKRPPYQSRAADTVSLGTLSGTSLSEPTLSGTTLDGSSLLPRPGAPEPLDVTQSALSGCSCKGSCGCQGGMAGIADSVPGGYVTLGIGALVAWKLLFKKRR